MRNDDVVIKNFGWGAKEKFAKNQHFIASYNFMDVDQEAPIESSGKDMVTLYVIGGSLVVTYFNGGKEKTECLCFGTNFELPPNVQYYLGTGTEQSAEFIEVRKGVIQ
tara:strand:- start:502 stop:825 length:324 start_codon:yes stop_codon:yes gene_type:complete